MTQSINILIIIIIILYLYRAFSIAIQQHFTMTEINIKCLKIPTGGWQTSWLFTQHSRGVELRATQNKSSQWQGGGLEHGTTRFQVQHPCCLFISLFYCHSLASFLSAGIVDLAGCIQGRAEFCGPTHTGA